MNENNIFPEDILRNTVEYHINKHNKKTNLIFWIIFLVLASSTIALPFIYVDVYTTSRGVITSSYNSVTLFAPVNGRITYYNLLENKEVKKGDTLLIINQQILKERENLIEIQKKETVSFITDLENLLNGHYNQLKTKQYFKEYLSFQQDLFNINTVLDNEQTEYDRAKTLYDKGVIAKAEYDIALLELDQLKNERTNLIKQAKLAWQKELTTYQQSLESLTSDKKQLEVEKDMYVITAPINGQLINVQGYNLGSTIGSGNTLALISPSENLLVESFISPAEIGYIEEGVAAKYQVDSYNSNQWGFATGTIIDVGKDIIQVDNTNGFKIRSSMNEEYLSLSNGARGELKKGMTVTSRFFLTRRSLFQLLFDKIDDWFNPYTNVNE